jgi:hypothetical protein
LTGISSSTIFLATGGWGRRPIGLARAFQREARVFVSGLGLGLPLVSLLTLISSYQTLKREKAANWDRRLTLRVVHRRRGPAQNIGFIIATALLIGLIQSFVAFNAALS